MNLLLVMGLAMLWLTFAPIKLGGQVSYAIINGISMEPNFHSGDLVLVRKASTYQVGDIVIYHDPLMNAEIIHRIIGTQQGRFIMKGDNNLWVDAYQPTLAEILGKFWIYLPKFGNTLLWFHYPLNMTLTAGALGGLLTVNFNPQKPDKKRKKKQKAGWPPPGDLEIALYAGGILALVCLVLVVLGFTHPLLRAGDALKYNQTGQFSYSAGSPAGVYDQDAVSSGDPVFTRLNCSLNLTFNYILSGPPMTGISGNLRLDAVLEDATSGWKRTLPLANTAHFTGSATVGTATIDLCQVQALVTAVEKQTGVTLKTSTLAITAHVAISGIISGQALADTFVPQMVFNFDDLHFYLKPDASQASSPTSAGSPPAPQNDPLTTTIPGTLNNPDLVDNSMALLGLNLSVRAVRVVSLLGLFLSLAGLIGLGYYFYAATRDNPEAAIRIQYNSLLVNVYDRSLRNLTSVIDVASISDLAKLAEHQNVMIMHLAVNFADYYFVQSEGKTYRYVAGKPTTKKGE